MKFLLLSIISGVSIAGATPLEKNVILKEIMSLPPNLFYEESSDSFQKIIDHGKFRVDQEEKTASLIGSFKQSLFSSQ